MTLSSFFQYLAHLHTLFVPLYHTFPPNASSLGTDILFSKEWQVLGPFPIGTREAAWGVDSLELYGGFHELPVNRTASYPSSLARNGTVSWLTAIASIHFNPDCPLVATADLSIAFQDVDWHFQQQVYGWAALQWQAWVRGNITVPVRSSGADKDYAPVTVALQVSPILEFWIDETHYWGGDFYGFHRAPLILHLVPGMHSIEIRLVRDVRAMGGITDEPAVDVKLELAEQSREGMLVQYGRALVADLVFVPGKDGSEAAQARLATPLMQVVLRNNAADETVWVSGIEFEDGESLEHCNISLLATQATRFAPGQTRSIGLNLTCETCYASSLEQIRLHAIYSTVNTIQSQQTLPLVINLSVAQSIYAPHKITYLHPSGMISHSLVRPPSRKAIKTCFSNSSIPHKLPVLLVLHGAGVDLDSPLARDSLNALPNLCAWSLWPSGVTPWSGDDWHTFGMRDVLASIASLSDWRAYHPIASSSSACSRSDSWPNIDGHRWLVMGHSNGGQGTWAILLHYPDNVIAAAPVSGYSSIQNYVPYTSWHPAAAGKTTVMQTVLEGWRHELLLPNAKGIPILQQHGGADDNVPPYHSRLMHSLLPEAGWDSTYSEVPGQPHWWDGVMTTPELQAFSEEQIRGYQDSGESLEIDWERVRSFEVVSANPAETGSKHGIRILLLGQPGQVGRVSISCHPSSASMLQDTGKNHPASQFPVTVAKGTACQLRTWNIRALELPIWPFSQAPSGKNGSVILDGQILRKKYMPIVSASGGPGVILLRSRTTRQWEIQSITEDGSDREIFPQTTRWGRQLGSLDAVLRTEGPVEIISHLPDIYKGAAKEETKRQMESLALQVSRNLQTYFYADSIISTSHNFSTQSSVVYDSNLDTETCGYAKALKSSGNIISLSLSSSLPCSPFSDPNSPYYDAAYTHAITVHPSGRGLSIRDMSDFIHNYTCSSSSSSSSYSAFSSSRSGIGAIFLRPLPGLPRERLELVVWGSSLSFLQQAARLVPTLTGTGIPDYVVLGEEARWKGLDGVLAMGWLDENWQAGMGSWFD